MNKTLNLCAAAFSCLFVLSPLGNLHASDGCGCCEGQRGHRGERGHRGHTGERGAIGPAGAPGATGATGGAEGYLFVAAQRSKIVPAADDVAMTYGVVEFASGGDNIEFPDLGDPISVVYDNGSIVSFTPETEGDYQVELFGQILSTNPSTQLTFFALAAGGTFHSGNLTFNGSLENPAFLFPVAGNQGNETQALVFSGIFHLLEGTTYTFVNRTAASVALGTGLMAVPISKAVGASFELLRAGGPAASP